MTALPAEAVETLNELGISRVLEGRAGETEKTQETESSVERDRVHYFLHRQFGFRLFEFGGHGPITDGSNFKAQSLLR